MPRWMGAGFGFGLVACLSVACGQPAQPPNPGALMAMAPITATAPKGVDDAILGAHVDVHFQRLQGSYGRPIFAQNRVRRLPRTYVSHDIVTITDRLSLDAHLSAWKVNAQGSYEAQSRFGSYRAFQIVGISSIDEAADVDNAPPNEAVFYVSKVYWGHSYEAVFEGNGRSFGAGLGVELGKYGGGFNAFATSHQMKLHFVGSGLVPKSGDGLFARTPNEVLSAYQIASAPVPIMVEYRLIPRRPVPMNQALGYELPMRVTIRFRGLRVQEDGSWGTTPWMLQARCSAGSGPFVLVPIISDRVKGGQTYSLNQNITLEGNRGDPVECYADGTYQDAIAHGQIAPGRSAPTPLSPGALRVDNHRSRPRVLRHRRGRGSSTGGTVTTETIADSVTAPLRRGANG